MDHFQSWRSLTIFSTSSVSSVRLMSPAFTSNVGRPLGGYFFTDLASPRRLRSRFQLPTKSRTITFFSPSLRSSLP